MLRKRSLCSPAPCAAVLVAACLCLAAGGCTALRVGIASYEPGAPVLSQNLTLGQLAYQLQTMGHEIELLYDINQIANQVQRQDLIVSQGQAALDIADYAHTLGIPTVRFVDSEDILNPAYERPALIVLPQNPLCRLQPPTLDGSAGLPQCEDSAPEMFLEVPRFKFEGALHFAALNEAMVKAHRAATACAPRSILIDLGVEKEEAPLPLPLGLLMMVKNEADFIRQTLESVKPVIDYWSIVDTGSTDNTMELIQETMKDGPPGQLLEKKFEDFSTSRNLVMAAHGNRTSYAIMIDGDYVLKNGWRLRATCERLLQECRHRSINMCSQAMFITKRYTGFSHMWTRIFPTEGMGTEQGWHYYYPIHEWPMNKLTAYQGGRQTITMKHVEEAFLTEAHLRSTVKSTKRLEENDLPLLRRWRVSHAHDHRIAFYLAQTLMALQRWEEAVAAYADRIALGGYHMELYEAKMKSALCLQQLGRDPTAMLQDAHLNSPWRAEPLYELAKWHDAQLRNCSHLTSEAERVHCENKHHMGAFLNAKLATEIPLPADDEGLVDTTVYGATGHAAEMLAVHAFFVAKDTYSQPGWQRGVYDTGFNAANFLAHSKPEDTRLRLNLASYERLRPYVFPA